MGTPEVSVRICLCVLITFCGRTWSVLPHMNEYQPSVVKPMFDLLQAYGLQMKSENKKEMCGMKNQFLVVVMASHQEILNPPVNINSPRLKEDLENRFKDKLIWLPNKKLAKCQPAEHGEVRFIRNRMVEPMFARFRQEHQTEKPVLLMYSHFIPCADIQGIGYSCSEELGIFATINWKDFGLLVAYSQYFAGFAERKGTNKNKAIDFLQRAGIPVFQYEDTSNGKKLINVNSVKDAYKEDRWRSVTFLHVFFSCLDGEISRGCLPDKREAKKAVITFFVNSIAFKCFNNMDFLWRRSRGDDFKNCSSNYFDENIGSKCSVKRIVSRR